MSRNTSKIPAAGSSAPWRNEYVRSRSSSSFVCCQLLPERVRVVGEALGRVRCTERIEPVARLLPTDRLRADIPGEAREPTRVTSQDRVPGVPSTPVPEHARLAVDGLDRLAIGSHYDPERGDLDGEDSHTASVARHQPAASLRRGTRAPSRV